MSHYQAPMSASLLAKWFVQRAANANAGDLDNLKLQKLLFLSHSHYLHSHGTALMRERVEAWKHGPVIDVVYQEYKSFGDGRITLPLSPSGPWSQLPTDIVMVLEDVWDSFAVLSGWALRELTHSVGPWRDCYDASQLHVEIPNDEIGGAWPMFEVHAADRGPEATALRRLEELRRKAAEAGRTPVQVNSEALLREYDALSQSRREATSLLS